MKTALIILLNIGTLLAQNWVVQPVVPQPDVLFSVNAYSRNIAWASGESGTVLHTLNAGANWNYKSGPFGSANVYSIQAVNPTTALCVCNIGGGKVFRTSNEGISWTNPFTRSNVTLTDLEFVNANTGFIFGNPVGNRFFIIRTTNGGLTFDTTSVIRPIAANSNVQIFTNSTQCYQAGVGGPINVWFGTSSGHVYYSTNTGVSWDSAFVQSGDAIYSVTFMDQNRGFSGGQDPFMTINGGASWIFQANYPNTGRYYSFDNAGGYFWYTSGASIYVSTNNGTTFTSEYTNPSNQDFRHLSMGSALNDNNMTLVYGYGIASDGLIVHYEESIGINPIGTSIPEKFALHQNYPNPFNPKTKIRFDLPEKEFLSIAVYDILGNQVEILFSGELKAGVYETDFDASQLSSGVYFYSVKTPSIYETRKMIVVK